MRHLIDIFAAAVLCTGVLTTGCNKAEEKPAAEPAPVGSAEPAVKPVAEPEAPVKPEPVAEVAKAPKSFDAPPKVGSKATCPVMGNEFEVKEDSERSEFNGKHVVFCCAGCKPKFDADPAKFL